MVSTVLKQWGPLFYFEVQIATQARHRLMMCLDPFGNAADGKLSRDMGICIF